MCNICRHSGTRRAALGAFVEPHNEALERTLRSALQFPHGLYVRTSKLVSWGVGLGVLGGSMARGGRPKGERIPAHFGAIATRRK